MLRTTRILNTFNGWTLCRWDGIWFWEKQNISTWNCLFFSPLITPIVIIKIGSGVWYVVIWIGQAQNLSHQDSQPESRNAVLMFIRRHLRLNFWFGQINHFNTRKTFSRVYYEHKCKCVFIVAVQIPTSLVLWSIWAGTCLSGQFCHCPPVITSWPISQKYLGFFVNKIFGTS